MTPEGKIKQSITAVLKSFGDRVYYHMPVPGGYGRSALDYLGFAAGLGFAVEAKRRGKEPTERQAGVIAAMEKAGAKVFVVDGYQGLAELERWLTTVVGSSCS